MKRTILSGMRTVKKNGMQLKNNIKFIINESVCFDPDKNTLYPCLRPESAIKLHTPTGKCLHLLLLQNAKTVTQQFLFAEVWEKNGFIVSNSTLYQNISALRKALRGAGIIEEIIKTVPKIGFKSIARLREVQDENNLPETDFARGEQPQVLPVVAVPAELKASEPASCDVDYAHYLRHHKAWYCLVVTVFIICSFACYRSLYKRPISTAGFPFVTTVGGCKVFSSRTTFNPKRLQSSSLLKRAAAHCNPGDFIYLTMSQGYGMSSAIICDKANDKPLAICKSYLTAEDANE